MCIGCFRSNIIWIAHVNSSKSSMSSYQPPAPMKLQKLSIILRRLSSFLKILLVLNNFNVSI